MKIIRPYTDIISPLRGDELERIEEAARTCYKSEENITKGSAEKLVRSLIKNGHHAMLEHVGFTARFVCDRGISHELVRHRLASFAQESTRYCNYAKEGESSELTFIWPSLFDGKISKSRTYTFTEIIQLNDEAREWYQAMSYAEDKYIKMIQMGMTPQWARSVLPNSIKTEVVMTANMREWRHFFELRALGLAGKPHPQMQELAIDLLLDAQNEFPVLFDDLVEIYLRTPPDTINKL